MSGHDPDTPVVAALRRSARLSQFASMLACCVLAGGLQAMLMLSLAVAQPPVPGAGHGFLIDKHVTAGLTCGKCHTETPPAKAPEMAMCLTCHGGTYAKLAATTAQDQPNPHASHRGEEPCGSCHNVHKASVTLCNQCHSFDMTTP